MNAFSRVEAESATLCLARPTPEPGKKFHEIRRRLRFETQPFASYRMAKGEQPGVQCLSREGANQRRQWQRKPVRLGEKRPAMVTVANERMADMGHMNPDLMGSPGFKPAFNEACYRTVF